MSSGLAGFRAVSSDLSPIFAVLAAVLVSVTLFSCKKPVGADTEVPAVQGDVRSALTGGPLSGAVVTLMQHGELVRTAQTFADGSYVFTGIEASAGYTVTASASLHIESATAEFAVSGNHVKDITLDRDWPTGGTDVATSVPYNYGIAVAPDGTIYFTDSDNNKIRKIAPGGTTAEDYAGTGDAGVADGLLASATFNGPAGITVSADGTRVYVAETGGNRVRLITGGQVFTIAGSGSGGFSGDNGDAKQAELNCPIGVAVDAAGNVYIADSLNQVVRKISAADGKITRIAGGGGETQDEGNALSAQLSFILYSIAVDTQGNVYITDNHRVRKITPAGYISTVIGTTGSGPNLPQLEYPLGITVDAAGTVYVADSNNHRIVKVLANGIASVLAANGLGGETIWSPRSLAIGPDGRLYIYDSNNERLMKY